MQESYGLRRFFKKDGNEGRSRSSIDVMNNQMFRYEQSMNNLRQTTLNLSFLIVNLKYISRCQKCAGKSIN